MSSKKKLTPTKRSAEPTVDEPPKKKAKIEKSSEEESSSEEEPKKQAAVAKAISLDDQRFTGKGSAGATKRLIKEYETLTKMDPKEYGIEGGPVDDDNFYKWRVKFTNFGSDTDLGRDLQRHKKSYGTDNVELEVKFPNDFPWSPPFIRVVKPRFAYRTGHVTVGGSICMEMLTRSGWLPANTIESVLVAIRSEMIEGGARLEGTNFEYTESEAKEAFHRVAQQHGWE
jgi:ubiquitin-conjugating enzyme E2 Q